MSRLSRPRSRSRDDRPSASPPRDEELTALHWQAHTPAVLQAGMGRMLRALPAMVRQILSLTWAADSRAALTVIVLQLGAGVLGGFGLLAFGDVLSRLLAGAADPARLTSALPAAIVAGAIYGVRNLAEFIALLAQARLKPAVKRLADERLYEATVHAELAAFDDAGFHDSMARARDQAMAHVELAIDRLIEVAAAVIGLMAVVSVVGVLHPVLVPMLVLSALPAGYAAVRAARLMHQSLLRRTALHRRLWMLARLLADRGPAAEVRTCTAQQALLAERRRLAMRYESEEVRVVQAQVRGVYAGNGLVLAATAATVAVLGWMFYAGAIPLAMAGTAVVAIRTGQTALVRLTRATADLFEQGLYLRDYADFVRQARARRRPVTGRSVRTDFEEIRLVRATFAYPGRDDPAVRDVTLSIKRGQIVALVGENGSGKSTVAKLIAGLYQPQSGAVYWGTTALSEVDERSVHENVAFVMQNPTQWPMTARENITIGRAERADPEGVSLRYAATASGVHSIVARLPEGYDTLLSKEFKGGRDLSGGEWQRMAVARAFYRDAPVLICDEPSAAMDAVAEQEIFARLRELAEDRTVILITHRLSATRDADVIFVMHRGCLIESGSHDELMAAKGAYHRLYSLQARGYTGEPVAVG